MFHHPSHSSTTIYSPKQLPKSILTTSRTLYSYTLNPFSKSPARDDLLINFLVSLFTPYKNFTSVPFNLGRMCLKQISSHFTTKSHKESLAPLRLFCPRVVIAPDDVTTFVVVSRHKRLLLSQKKRFSSRRVFRRYVCKNVANFHQSVLRTSTRRVHVLIGRI